LERSSSNPANSSTSTVTQRRNPTDIDPQEPEELPGLHLAFDPQFYGGRISDFCRNGFSYTPGAVYVHGAVTMGGNSGGPMLRLADSSVYGVTSRGCEWYGTASDI
jgi:hypothetical protein